MLQESLFKHAQAFKTVIIKCKYFFLKGHKHPNVDILTSVRPLSLFSLSECVRLVLSLAVDLYSSQCGATLQGSNYL